MYAIDEGTDSLYSIDTSTGASSLIGPAGEDFSFSGLAWDSWSQIMYVSDVTMNGPDWGLGRIDIQTGATTVIGSHVTTSNIWGLAFDCIDNALYGADGGNQCLATINRGTGEASCVGSYGTGEPIGGLAFDNSADVLYGIGDTSLFTIDKILGTATAIGPHGITMFGIAPGLEFDSATGTLYASTGSDTMLYILDPMTGVASPIGAHGLDNLGGLASTTAPGDIDSIFHDGFESGNTSAWD